jgi:hypothetical protein
MTPTVLLLLLLSQADGPLRPGAYASLGHGVDHAR